MFMQRDLSNVLTKTHTFHRLGITFLLMGFSFGSGPTWSACDPLGNITGINGPVTLGALGCATASGNTASVISGASIANAGGNGILGSGVAWSITVDGSISGTGIGINLQNGGSITNQSNGSIMTTSQGIYAVGGVPSITLINSGVISSSSNIGAQLLGGGAVTNLSSGLIEGAFIGLELSGPNGPNPSGGPSVVDNSGTIRSTSGFNQGTLFGMGGSLLNRSTGLIDAGGVAVGFSAIGTVDNFGQIGVLNNSSTAIGLGQGGTVTNELGGSILATSRGVSIDGNLGTINNYGLIKALNARAINISAGGTVNNASTGVIEAFSRAVRIEGGTGAINNAGVITGDIGNGGFNAIELLSINSSVLTSGTINGNTQFFAPNGTFIINGGAVNGDIIFTGANNTFIFNGGIMNGEVTLGPGGSQTLILRNITNANITNVSLLNGGTGSNNQLTFINSEYIGGSDILNWESITLDTSTLTLTSNLIVGGSAPSALTATLTIDDATLNAQNGLNTLISATNATPVLVNNAGIINIATPTASNSLTILGNYLGNAGLIDLNAILNADGEPADKLVVNGINGGGSASGNTFLRVHNIGGVGAQTTNNGILVVEAIQGATTTSNAFSLSAPLRSGAYDYRLFRGGLNPNDPAFAEDWFLRSTFVPTPTPLLPIIGPELSVFASVLPTAMNMGTISIGTLHERVGDEMGLNSNYPTSGKRFLNGTWVRIFNQSYHEQFTSLAAPNMSGNVLGGQAGLDLYRDKNAYGALDFAGFYLAYDTAKPNIDGLITNVANTDYIRLRTGSIDLNAKTGGLYWTHFLPSGAYLDLNAQASSYQGHATSFRTSLGLHGEGTVESLEVGYPLAIFPNWSFEPEAQVMHEYVHFNRGRDMYSTVDLGSSSAVIGRAGVRLAHSMELHRHQISPYIRANIWSVLAGDKANAVVYANADSINGTAKTKWAQLGGG